MTEIKMEKPIVSKELAQEFSVIRNQYFFVRVVIDSDKYSENIPEKSKMSWGAFESLLSQMFVLGYEIKKTKKFYIKLIMSPRDDFDLSYLFVNYDDHKRLFNYFDKNQTDEFRTQFTKEEVDNFFRNHPRDLYEVIEVPDND